MEVQKSKMQNTKKGVAAIYVVVFTTMLIGIITLSFLRIMLSESGRTLNDTLSDSAYNAALAGVEDAKYVISQYEKAVISGANEGFVEAVEGADAQNCDIISDAMEAYGGTGTNSSDKKETNIGVEGDSFQDQAYTCVTINLSGDFKGTLSKNNPTLVVPLKPKNAKDVDNISGVRIIWKMSAGDESGAMPTRSLKDSGLNDTVNNENAINTKGDQSLKKVLGRKGIMSDSDFVALNGLRVMLVQSPLGEVADYYASGDGRTNRGTLMLLASTDDYGYNEIGSTQFVDSADKTLNAPIPVKCTSESCEVWIEFPKPRWTVETNEHKNERDPDNFFLVLNQLYSEPGITVTVDMFDNEKNIVPFFNVQPIVDSTGRSGDLFRRVEARIGTDNGASLIPTAELSSNGDIDKSFYVTKNCINGTGECTQ